MVLNDLFLVGSQLWVRFYFWAPAGFGWFQFSLVPHGLSLFLKVLTGFLLVLISWVQTGSGLWFWSLALVGSNFLDPHGLGRCCFQHCSLF